MRGNAEYSMDRFPERNVSKRYSYRSKNMSGYDLIAFDMDGTLLTSKNKSK